jgi:hypothetical protein
LNRLAARARESRTIPKIAIKKTTAAPSSTAAPSLETSQDQGPLEGVIAGS